MAAGPYPGVPEVRRIDDKEREEERKRFPPVVIYRFDDDRYLTLESRYYCRNGVFYYHDTRHKIRTEVASTGEVFAGFFVSSSPNTIVVPRFTSSDCSNAGGNICGMYLYFSVDGGRTFEELNGPWGALKTPDIIAVEGNKLFLTDERARNAYSITLAPGKRLTKNQPDFENEPVPASEVLKRAASPSGETRFQCREK
jgi:hypothetical protein